MQSALLDRRFGREINHINSKNYFLLEWMQILNEYDSIIKHFLAEREFNQWTSEVRKVGFCLIEK